jgi:hypothetical protein
VRALRWIVIVLATALVAGIAGGVGARIAMRVVALTDSDPGTTFTAGGTFGIVLVAVVLGAIVGDLLFDAAAHPGIAHAEGARARRSACGLPGTALGCRRGRQHRSMVAEPADVPDR